MSDDLDKLYDQLGCAELDKENVKRIVPPPPPPPKGRRAGGLRSTWSEIDVSFLLTVGFAFVMIVGMAVAIVVQAIRTFF